MGGSLELPCHLLGEGEAVDLRAHLQCRLHKRVARLSVRQVAWPWHLFRGPLEPVVPHLHVVRPAVSVSMILQYLVCRNGTAAHKQVLVLWLVEHVCFDL